MFTGLVEEVGRVTSIVEKDGLRRVSVAASQLTRELKIGNSIAVSGVCLTAVEVGKKHFAADLALETWNRTSFSRMHEGALVNLELPMRADGRLGGHLVQGHVDGTGKFLSLEQIPGGEDYWLNIEVPAELDRYIIHKGSLSIEGISLTIAKIENCRVRVAIIPHTWEMTNLRSLQPGDPVNLEVDMIAKYVEKMLRGDNPQTLTVEQLVAQGF
jgi:riboflavin synthase